MEQPQQQIFDLTDNQRTIYAAVEMDPESVAYNMPLVFRVIGTVDPGGLERAIQLVIARHDAFRVAFIQREGEVHQELWESCLFKLDVDHRLNGLETEAALPLFTSRFLKPFDLSAPPLMRACLASLTNVVSLLGFDFSHIIFDRASIPVFFNDLSSAYAGKDTGISTLRWVDLVNAQARRDLAADTRYWAAMYSSEIVPLQLPIDYPRSNVRKFAGARHKIVLGEKLSQDINGFCNEHGITPFVLLLSAYAILLSRYAGHEDVIIGTPADGRLSLEAQKVVGMFANTLPLRLRGAPKERFLDYARKVMTGVLDGAFHQNLAFEKIVALSGIQRNLSRNPLFDTMFVYEDGWLQNLTLGEAVMTSLAVETKSAMFEMTWRGSQTREGELEFQIQYAPDVYALETVQRMSRHYVRLLEEIIRHPWQELGKLDLVGAEERRILLGEFNDTAAEYPSARCIHELFEEQVERRPEAVAMVCEGESLTFGQLNARANQLAQRLRERGVKPDQLVAIMVDRSLEMIIGILGILKAGGAYVPIDPNYPKERIEYMLEDSRAKVLLTQGRYIQDTASFPVEAMDLQNPMLYRGTNTDPKRINKPTDLIYVIYTSGSTGKPKGAMLEHRGVVNRLIWMARQYQVGPGEVILQKTTYTFDVSVWELLLGPITGATTCLLKLGGEKEPSEIRKAIDQQGVTLLHFVPSVLSVFLRALEPGTRFKRLKHCICSGEALQVDQKDMFYRKIKGVELHNLYGPTEASIDVTYYKVGEADKTIPIGRPVANTSLYVLNEDLRLMPIGVAGELCLGGIQLASGYLNQADLTKEKFVANPFREGERIYRTGDLARWLPDGNVEFLGRMDHQVKIRGYRIELGEIESVMTKVEGVRQTVVLAQADSGGKKYLCGYYEGEVEVTEMRQFLREKLPGYMVPSCLVKLEKLPLTLNGKIDRKALPEACELTSSREYQAPRNELEAKLVEIWKEVIGLQKVGIDDNFFEIGGHNLKAMQLVSRIHDQLGIEVGIREIFRAPTVGSMGEYLAAKKGEAANLIPVIEAAETSA
jgi:amino acid adenylation domain-containing protein